MVAFSEGINGFLLVTFTEVVVPECCDNQVQRGGGSGIFLQSCALNDPCLKVLEGSNGMW